MLKVLKSLIILSVILLISCGEEEKEPTVVTGTHKVVVKEAMNASNYSYLLVVEENEEYWIAVPQMTITPGEELVYKKSLEMQNFQSPSLKRTFDKILFVEDAVKAADMQSVPTPHSQVKSAGKQDIKLTPISGGTTIQEIYANKENLNGKTVKIKGVVTRFNEEIMDRNWIHIQDGTGTNEDFDLLITSLDNTMVGKEIIVEGVVALNKDFGAGYSYAVLIEDAKIKSE